MNPFHIHNGQYASRAALVFSPEHACSRLLSLRRLDYDKSPDRLTYVRLALPGTCIPIPALLCPPSMTKFECLSC